MAEDTDYDGKRESEDPGNIEESSKTCSKEIEFIILIRGRNCAKTIEKCVRSLCGQTYGNWRAIISLDAPTDNSVEITRKAIDKKFVLNVNEDRFGLCQNMYWTIKNIKWIFNPEDGTVIGVLDADDWLSKDALKVVARVYRRYPKTGITHGSYKKLSKGGRTRVSRANPKKGNIRKLPWRSSHFKTIRWDVIKKVKPGWFQYKGKWLEAASDLALMFPCIEIAGLENVRFISKIIYYWNNKTTRRKRILQKKCAKILRGKKVVV